MRGCLVSELSASKRCHRPVSHFQIHSLSAREIVRQRRCTTCCFRPLRSRSPLWWYCGNCSARTLIDRPPRLRYVSWNIAHLAFEAGMLCFRVIFWGVVVLVTLIPFCFL